MNCMIPFLFVLQKVAILYNISLLCSVCEGRFVRPVLYPVHTEGKAAQTPSYHMEGET